MKASSCTTFWWHEIHLIFNQHQSNIDLCYLWTCDTHVSRKPASWNTAFRWISGTMPIQPLAIFTHISYTFLLYPTLRPWLRTFFRERTPWALCHSSLQIPSTPPSPVGGQFLIQLRVTGFVATINKQPKVSLISSVPALLQHWLQHKSHTDPEHKQAWQHKARN